ncbi:acyltransferase family protein [Agromyces bauzanensis]
MQRLTSIDLWRVVAVVVIVYRHTYPADSHHVMIASVATTFFFFLTGWLWRRGRRNVVGELRNRWLSLGVPYVSWFAAIWLIYVGTLIVSGRLSLGRSLSPILGGAYATRPFTTFWFFTALFVVAVLMRILDDLPQPALFSIAVVALGLGAFAGGALARIPLSIGVAIPCLAFALMGRLLHDWFDLRSWRVRWAAAIVLVLAIAVSLAAAAINLKYGDFGTPFLSATVAIAVAWAVIVLTEALFSAIPRLGQAITPLTSALAPTAIVVVLVHPMVLYLAQAVSTGAEPWIFPLALVVPWAAAFAISRTPLSLLLIGQRDARVPA